MLFSIGFDLTEPVRQAILALPERRIRSPSAPLPKPANTTRWIAPMRTQASISATASVQVGM